MSELEKYVVEHDPNTKMTKLEIPDDDYRRFDAQMKPKMNISELSENEIRESYEYDELVTMCANLQKENEVLKRDIGHLEINNKCYKQKNQSLEENIKEYRAGIVKLENMRIKMENQENAIKILAGMIV